MDKDHALSLEHLLQGATGGDKESASAFLKTILRKCAIRARTAPTALHEQCSKLPRSFF